MVFRRSETLFAAARAARSAILCFALATLAGYAATRTVGLPLANGDIGNWLEPIGLASIFIEALVVAIAVYAFAVGRRSMAAQPVGRNPG